jgi:glycosyltransferase involved in cell wall biosynthesis
MRIGPRTFDAPSPLVSCIMPTADRRRFAPQAIRRFLGQDYPSRELVVVDDGADPVADLIPADPRIRYFRVEPGRSLGGKRNLACHLARGALIAHWDDDDWAAPWRVSCQAGALMQAGADVCGIDRVLFLGPTADRAWEYAYPADEPAWVHGASLCYRRELWQRNPFPDVDIAEDCDFLWSACPKTILRLPDNRFYVGLIHAANASPKPADNARWRACPPAAIRQVVGGDWPELRALLAAD